MYDKYKNQIKQFFLNLSRKFKKIDGRTTTFLFFVLVSTILWFLNALSKENTTNIKIPVQFTGISDEYKAHSPLPQHLTLQITGQGFTLLRYKVVKPLAPFKYDLKPYFIGSSDSLLTVKIVTQLSKKQIEQYFDDAVTVGEIEPRNIDAVFSKLSFKNVAVKFVGDIKFASQFWLKGKIEMVPDSMIIGGPKSILDTVNFIYIHPVSFENVRQKVTKQTTVDDKGIFQIQKPEVKVTLDAEKYTEATLRLPIKVLNEPEKVNVMLFPDHANVKFLISLHEYERIDTSFFQLVADFSQINHNSNREQIKIDLLSYPNTVKILNINPREVTFVISVKK